MPTETYAIADLARLTGLNVRTIRYYLAQGLLPASGESGPGAHYGEGHLDRLRLTKRLQQQHLPLAEIRRRLADLSDPEVAGLVATLEAAPPVEPTTSALEYVRALLDKSGAQPAISMPATASASAATVPAPPVAAASDDVVPPAPAARPALLSRARYARMGMGSAVGAMQPAQPAQQATSIPSMPNPFLAAPQPAMAAPPTASTTATAAPSEPAGPERSQWERLELTPDIELHIRRPLSRLEQRRVERLITIARQVLKEDMK